MEVVLPLLARPGMRLDARTVRPLPLRVALPRREVGVDDRPVVLLGGRVDRRLREVRDATDVVEVHVRQDDVLHVGGREATRLDLADRGLGVVAVRPHQESGDSHALRVGEVVPAETAVDEHEAVRRLAQQDVADDLGHRGRVQRAAVEVVNTHGLDPVGDAHDPSPERGYPGPDYDRTVTRRSRLVLLAAALYGIALALIATWPTHVDQDFNVLSCLRGHGSSAMECPGPGPIDSSKGPPTPSCSSRSACC